MACKNLKIFPNPSNTYTNNECPTNLVFLVGAVNYGSFNCLDLSPPPPPTKICQPFAPLERPRRQEQASKKRIQDKNAGSNCSCFFFQVFHCHFNSNFFPLFLDKLLGDSISPQTGAILLGVSFVAPHINNLYFLGLCRRFGVYSVIKWLFYVKLGLSVIMLMVGPNWPILLCFYIAR